MKIKTSLVFALSCFAVNSCFWGKNSGRKHSEREIPRSELRSVTPILFDKNDRSCDGFPAAPIETMESICMGVVFQSQDAAFQPRALMEIPGQPDKFLVTDFAGWSTNAGTIWLLDASRGAGSVTLTPFLKGLSIVHQITLGPGGQVYFGEDNQISRFPVTLAQSGIEITRAQTSVAIPNLPPMMRGTTKNSMHPIKHFVFDKTGNVYINIGAYTDHCNDFAGRSCEESDSAIGGGSSPAEKDHGGVIRRYRFLGDITKGWDKDYRLVAKGLRNSMGLLFTPNGDLLQVENGRDFADSARPFEEINLIPASVITDAQPAKHYGWPYCYNYNEKSEEWSNFAFPCAPGTAKYEPPFSLLPPHSAPLGILQYSSDLMPVLKSKLIVPLHGYRPAGHRILSFEVDSSTGLPKQEESGRYFVDDLSGAKQNIAKSYPKKVKVSPATEVVSGWYDAPGVRGKGAPVALAQGTDGSIWIADDKNSAIFRMAPAGPDFKRKPPPARPNFAKAYSELVLESPKWLASYQNLKNKVLKSPQCAGCHDDYRNPEDDVSDGLAELRYIASLGTWIVEGDTEKSALFQKMSPAGASSMPPKDKPYASLAEAKQALSIVADFIKTMPNLRSIFVVQENANPEIVGLTRGQPGNTVCGKLKPGQTVWVTNPQPQRLRGIEVLEVLVGQNSKIADMSICGANNAFFVAASALKPIVN